MMLGRWWRSSAHRRARSIRNARALTTAAFDGRGAGAVSIQWLIWNSDASGTPRLAAHENWDGARNRYGVSSIVANAGNNQSTPGRPDSRNVTTRPPDAASSASVGHGGPGGPRNASVSMPLASNAPAISAGGTWSSITRITTSDGLAARNAC